MPSPYPVQYDALPRPTDLDTMLTPGVEGPTVIDALADAVEAIETELGLEPSGPHLTVKARLDLLGGLRVYVTDPEYGAVMDGATDDGPAVRAALTAVDAAGGGTVIIPAGTLRWLGVISVPSRVNLVGAGPYASTLVAGDAPAQIRFGDGGGVTVAINYGGMSGGFRINGAAATNPFFVGLCVSRTFADIDGIYALGDGIRCEQTQNCLFLQVNWTRAEGSNWVLDYGAGGNLFYTELYGGGRSNLRFTYSGPNAGGGYQIPTNNTFHTSRMEGTQDTTVAIIEHEAGTRNVLHNAHATLLSGAGGHADLYGTDIPVISMSRISADASAVSNCLFLTAGTAAYGSKPAGSSIYKGVGIVVANTPGQPDVANVYIDQGTLIAQCSSALSSQVASRIDVAGALNLGGNTARYLPIGGAHTEAAVIRRPGHTVDVRAYGAVGDGVADDTVPINYAISAASGAGSVTRRVRVTFPTIPTGTYLTDGILAKPFVWLDFGDAHLKKRTDGGTVNTNSLLRAVETLTGGTYYGTYKNITITGGLFDPNGKQCSAGIIRMLYCENLKMSGTRVKHDPACQSWAYSIGGRGVRLTDLAVTDGTLIFQDGIHIVHGQNLTIVAGNVSSGDDALSIGGEPTDAYLAADPDPIRNVTAVGPVLNSARVACVKVYVKAGAPDNALWEVTDVTVIGWSGGAKGMAPVVVRDENAHAAGSGRIRDIKVLGFTAFMGNSPTVPSSGFPGTPYGVHAQSVDRLEVDGNIEMRGDNTAFAGWRLAWAEDCHRAEITLRCRQLTSGGGFELVRCTDAYVGGDVVAGPDVSAPMVRLTASDVQIAANLLGQKSGHNVVEVQGPGASTVRASSGRWSHAAGASAGNAFAYVSTVNVTAVDLDGVDMAGCFNGVPANFWQLASNVKRPHVTLLSAGATVAALPAAAAAWRGRTVMTQGGAGVADEIYVCRKKADDAYEWRLLT